MNEDVLLSYDHRGIKMINSVRYIDAGLNLWSVITELTL